MTTLPILHSEELSIQMCNLTRLHLEAVDLSMFFVEPDIHEPQIFKDLLCGLDSISIIDPSLSGGDWSPFTKFLSRRAAVGNPVSSRSLSSRPQSGQDVAERIECAVKAFNVGH